jgi:hypothetical protein
MIISNISISSWLLCELFIRWFHTLNLT